MTRAGTDRRSLLIGGACLVGGATVARSAAAQGATDYAVFTELSTELKKMKDGWNRRIFTNSDARKGTAIQCDMASGVVTLAPGAYHLSGYSIVAYYLGNEPPETTTTRSPASAGYCRLRKVAAGDATDTLDMHAIDNGDPSVLCVGSPSSANLVPSLFETFYETDRPAPIVLEHQSGSKPEQIYLRVFVENSKWHAFARISIRRLG
jgi:hypothetical protein